MVGLLKLYKRFDIEELISSISPLINEIYIHIDYSDNETIEKLNNIISKTVKIPYKVFISKSNLGCSNAHKNALKWIYTFNVDHVLIIEDDLKLVSPIPNYIKGILVLSEHYWSYIINKETYEYIESFDLLDLDLPQIHKDLIIKTRQLDQPLIWDVELETKIKHLNIPFERYLSFKGTNAPTTRSNEAFVYVTHKNGKLI